MNGSGVSAKAMAASPATASTTRMTSGRAARSGARATASIGGAVRMISNEATTALWTAWISWSGPMTRRRS